MFRLYYIYLFIVIQSHINMVFVEFNLTTEDTLVMDIKMLC